MTVYKGQNHFFSLMNSATAHKGHIFRFPCVPFVYFKLLLSELFLYMVLHSLQINCQTSTFSYFKFFKFLYYLILPVNN